MIEKQQKIKKLNTDQKIDQVLGIVKVLSSDVGELKVDVKGLKTDVSELRVDMGNVKTDIKVLKTDVGELKVDMRNVKTDIKGLKTDVGELKTDVGGLKVGFKSLAEDNKLILQTMNDFSFAIEEKIDNLGTSLRSEMQGLEARMVSKDYLDRKLAETVTYIFKEVRI